MTKCSICNKRKGKRKCRETETFICSQCCGEYRSPDHCDGCSFFGGRANNRNYRKVPYYTIREMEASDENVFISNVIENMLALIWNADKFHVNDKTVCRLVEMMLDRYHFNAEPADIDDPVLADGYQRLRAEIDEKLDQFSREQLVKVLAAIYRSIQRRTNGGSSYLQFINHMSGGYYQA